MMSAPTVAPAQAHATEHYDKYVATRTVEKTTSSAKRTRADSKGNKIFKEGSHKKKKRRPYFQNCG